MLMQRVAPPRPRQIGALARVQEQLRLCDGHARTALVADVPLTCGHLAPGQALPAVATGARTLWGYWEQQAWGLHVWKQGTVGARVCGWDGWLWSGLCMTWQKC